jgi:valyl-tRNA synthetase
MVKSMHAYELAAATQAAYAFWQYDLCDVFIELAKEALGRDDADPGAAAAKRATRDTLWVCLEAGLRLLHPFMPYVTEELWQRLPRGAAAARRQAAATIMLAPYPAPRADWDSPQAEADMGYLLSVVARTRGLRSDYGLTKERAPLFVGAKDAARAAFLGAHLPELSALSTSSSAEVLPPGGAAPRGCGVVIVDEATTVHLLLVGVLDAAKELEKLAKKEADAGARAAALRRKMELASYAERTPADVRAADAERLAKAEAELEAARHHAEDMRGLL